MLTDVQHWNFNHCQCGHGVQLHLAAISRVKVCCKVMTCKCTSFRPTTTPAGLHINEAA